MLTAINDLHTALTTINPIEPVAFGRGFITLITILRDLSGYLNIFLVFNLDLLVLW